MADPIITEIKLLRREIRELKQLIVPVSTPHWVKGHEVMKLTGWSAEQMRIRRDTNTITWEKRTGKRGAAFFYDLNSVPVQLMRAV